MESTHRGGVGSGPVHAVPQPIFGAPSTNHTLSNRAGGKAPKAPRQAVSPRARHTHFDGSPWCPPWVRKLVVAGASVSDVVEAAAKRAKGHVTEETLVEVETLLNEIGKDPRHAEIVRTAVSREAVAHIMKKGAAT